MKQFEREEVTARQRQRNVDEGEQRMDCAKGAVDEEEVPSRKAGLVHASRVGKIERSADASGEGHLPPSPSQTSASTRPAGD
jgi:hypothetical protein